MYSVALRFPGTSTLMVKTCRTRAPRCSLQEVLSADAGSDGSALPSRFPSPAHRTVRSNDHFQSRRRKAASQICYTDVPKVSC